MDNAALSGHGAVLHNDEGVVSGLNLKEVERTQFGADIRLKTGVLRVYSGYNPICEES